MDARRALTIGGGATMVAGLAVATAFAVSNATALTDVAGSPISAAPLIVPSPAASPSSTPAATLAPTPSASAETVPAPEPRDVTAPTTPSKGSTTPRTQPKPSPSTPSASKPSPSAPAPSKPAKDDRTAEEVYEQFKKDGDWSKVEAWALAHGYDQATIDQWLQYLREHYGFQRSSYRTSQTPALAGTASGHHLPSSWTGSKRDQSATSP